MSYRTEINTLITKIIQDECKDKPEVLHFLEMAIDREMISLNRSRNSREISSEYISILEKCMGEQK